MGSPRPHRKTLIRREKLGAGAPQRYIAMVMKDDSLSDSNPHEMKTEEVLVVELDVLMREHRDLDEAISALEAEGRADMLTIRRLKKKKLSLKDKIARIEDILTPDIIA